MFPHSTTKLHSNQLRCLISFSRAQRDICASFFSLLFVSIWLFIINIIYSKRQLFKKKRKRKIESLWTGSLVTDCKLFHLHINAPRPAKKKPPKNQKKNQTTFILMNTSFTTEQLYQICNNWSINKSVEEIHSVGLSRLSSWQNAVGWFYSPLRTAGGDRTTKTTNNSSCSWSLLFSWV